MTVRPVRRARIAMALVAGVALSGAWPVIPEETTRGPDRRQRLESLRSQIERLEAERARIASRERGVLGELERSRAELALARTRLAEVLVRLDEVDEAIVRRTETIDSLVDEQSDRTAYLRFRIARLYREGPARAARVALGGNDVESYLGGLRYAAWLGARDARVLGSYRRDQNRLREERDALRRERDVLEATRAETEARRSAAESARRRQASLLARLRDDRARRDEALRELAGAAAALAKVVDDRTAEAGEARLDMTKFRGLLEPPVAGRVTEGFGDVVHPRFKTRVPHPGLDYSAPEGTPFNCVFDGRVVYASWLRGYGLTAIVDHGHDIVTVYAHASALLVEPGEEVLRGQRIGYVGETGSLEGPFLYFELRSDRRPVDPAPWFRK